MYSCSRGAANPLPFHEPGRLVMVWEDASFIGFPRNTPAPANYEDWKAQNDVFEDMAALGSRRFNLTGDGEPERVSAYGVSAAFFPLLGVKPALGRVFLPEEDQPEANKVAVISYKLWQSRYGGEPNIVGRDILLTGEKHTVVGVMPAGFQFLESQIGIWYRWLYRKKGGSRSSPPESSPGLTPGHAYQRTQHQTSCRYLRDLPTTRETSARMWCRSARSLPGRPGGR